MREADAKGQLPEGYERVPFKGRRTHDVVIRKSVTQEVLKDADADQRAGLDDLLERFATHGPQGLPRPKLNGNEGWFPSEKAPGKVRLQAFKPWQLRAYFFVREFAGRPTAFIVGVDCSKKQNKANQSKLNAAGAEAVRISKLLK